MANLYENIVKRHPQIRERKLEDRVKAVLDAAYGFQVSPDLERLQSYEAATDAVEVLKAASDLASMLVGFPPDERPSGIGAILKSLTPPALKDDDDT
jgi:hypothetical protein